MIIKASKYRRLRPNQVSASAALDSPYDNVPIKINRRDTTRTDGSVIGMQSGPNQTVTTTHQVTGVEFRARSNAVGTGGLLGVSSNPQATSASDATGPVKAYEANITVKGTRTSSEIDGMRLFLDVDATVTATAGKNVITIATPNASGWTNLINSETDAGCHVVDAGTYSTADGYFIVQVAGNTYRMPFFAAVD